MDETTESQLLTGSVQEIDLAVERHEVTFPMVLKLLYLSLSPRKDLSDSYRDLYRRALAQFTENCGGIRESFYANEFVAGVLLTQRDELFFNIWWDEFKFDTIPARSLEADLNDLRLKAGLYLSEEHRRVCTARLFRLYKTLISCLHNEYYRWSGKELTAGKAACSQEYAADVRQIYRELTVVRDSYNQLGSERGQTRYVAAAAIGTTIILALAIGSVAISARSPSFNPSEHVWPGVFAGGAIGALLSILERLTRSALRVQFQTGLAAIFISGISRPIVGALSGLALCVLIEGGLLPFISVPPAKDKFFLAGFAFLAGFSERLLKDAVGNATGSVTASKSNPSPDETTNKDQPISPVA
jgi:hypothetical protein